MWLELLQTLVTLYVGWGAYCGYVWTRDGSDSDPWSISFAMTAGAFMGIILWPFAIGDNRVPAPTKKTGQTKAMRTERKRMNKELANERGRVQMIEASAEHRREMSELSDRVRRAEEAA